MWARSPSRSRCGVSRDDERTLEVCEGRDRQFAPMTVHRHAWYAELLDLEPYFERSGPDGRPAYYEFRLGDHQDELGLIDRRFAPPGGADRPGGAVVYWHVDDVSSGLRPAAGRRGRRARPAARAGPRLRHRVGRRPVRQRARRDDQPAPRPDARPGEIATTIAGFLASVPAVDRPAGRGRWMGRHRSPREKKVLTYTRDRRNDYGVNDKASRRAIRRKKRLPHRANRHHDHQRLTALAGAPDTGDRRGRRGARLRAAAERRGASCRISHSASTSNAAAGHERPAPSLRRGPRPPGSGCTGGSWRHLAVGPTR